MFTVLPPADPDKCPEMDWSSWRDAKVGEVMAETAEALVTELLLSRKVALDTNRSM